MSLQLWLDLRDALGKHVPPQIDFELVPKNVERPTKVGKVLHVKRETVAKLIQSYCRAPTAEDSVTGIGDVVAEGAIVPLCHRAAADSARPPDVCPARSRRQTADGAAVTARRCRWFDQSSMPRWRISGGRTVSPEKARVRTISTEELRARPWQPIAARVGRPLSP